jgi:murein DD-endopeptidase MepM/ murein hydrolase activator NlpD
VNADVKRVRGSSCSTSTSTSTSRARAVAAALALALSVMALALSAPVYAYSDGGVQAPSAALSGGSEYGVVRASAAAHPVVSALHVPAAALAGRLPRMTMRLDEAHVATVNVTVAVHDLTTRRAALVARMGWVHTGRTIAVVWPRGARLPPGSYRVSVSAHDHGLHSLTRTAHSSGVATLTVSAPPAPAIAPPAPGAPAPVPAAGAPTPAQTLADGAVFPVAGAHSFGGPENRYGAPRSGHLHEGQDVLTTEGTPDVAPLAGTITYTSYQAAGAGYYAVEHTTIGFDFMFAHCKRGSLAVGVSQSVAAGSTICLAGQSGDATAPHLHFEIWLGPWQTGGHTIDPLPYLEAWERAG